MLIRDESSNWKCKYPRRRSSETESLIKRFLASFTAGCILCLGQSNYFRFNHPIEARRIKNMKPDNEILISSPNFIPVTIKPASVDVKPIEFNDARWGRKSVILT
eukprot:g27738.t1